MEHIRCPWCAGDELYTAYHDEEWGVPCRDGGRLFEFLLLEGAQAGLSWITILKKRENYRRAFDGFDPEKIARYGESDIERLLADPGIIRNRAKIASAVNNARRYLELGGEEGGFAGYIWSFVDGRPIVNDVGTSADVPAKSEISERMSRELKRRGFTFVGPVVCYAYMQAVGLVDDHLNDCFKKNRKA